jgi:hypothetical protein
MVNSRRTRRRNGSGRKRIRVSRKRSKTLKARKVHYRKRVKKSTCRKKGPAACRGTAGCKYASGKKRRYCRKNKNKKL